MTQLIFRQKTLLITLPLLTLLASNYTHAEIYKWRDNRGVIQYSDRPPVDSFAKLTANEVVNSLQQKDLCTVGPIKKITATTVASNKDYSGFFSVFKNAKIVAAQQVKNNTTIAQNTPVKPPVQVVVIKPPLPVVTAPPATKPPLPVVTAPPATKPPLPVVTAPPATKPPLPVVTAPPATTNPSAPPNIVQAALMPAVNISKNMAAVVGYNTLKISATTEKAPNSDIGAFRIPCEVAFMANDDPLVYPNQQGASHHHTFFGNTSVNYKSNLETLSTTGNSTCLGGTMNRSGYWVPSMINTETNTPITPSGNILVYYKAGYSIDSRLITTPPKGLRMIAGNSKATTSDQAQSIGFVCHPGPNSKRNNWPRTVYITKKGAATCDTGDILDMEVFFPQCWNGKDLDSPNHKDHMAYTAGNSCPASHPVPIPEIGFNVKFVITASDNIDKWRLASDNYSATLPGGFSGHGDWVNGWDEKLLDSIVKNCINTKRDCHAHLLGDGRMMY